MGAHIHTCRHLLCCANIHPASFQRNVLRSFTLSDGRVVPAGVTIEVPAIAVSTDPDVFDNADTYGPLRFHKMRQRAVETSNESDAPNHLVNVSANSLNFGYGRQARPGRFFAANEIKIFTNALMKYDFKLPDGETDRYRNMEFAHGRWKAHFLRISDLRN